MNKKVNIYPKTPILTVNPPIRSSVRRVTKSIDEIRACIIARAVVEEILDDGSTIRLDFTNYDKDNTFNKVEKVIEKTEQTEVNTTETVTNNDQNKYKKNFKNKNTSYKTFDKSSDKEEKVETIDAENL